jgi:hypothetical protein
MRGHEVEIEVIVECENTQMSKGPNALVGGFRPISHRIQWARMHTNYTLSLA